MEREVAFEDFDDEFEVDLATQVQEEPCSPARRKSALRALRAGVPVEVASRMYGTELTPDAVSANAPARGHGQGRGSEAGM